MSLKKLGLDLANSFMCSFEIKSLFTLDKTIRICANAMYWDELVSPPFPEEVFVELMKSVTRSGTVHLVPTNVPTTKGRNCHGEPIRTSATSLLISTKAIFLYVHQNLGFFFNMLMNFSQFSKKSPTVEFSF